MGIVRSLTCINKLYFCIYFNENHSSVQNTATCKIVYIKYGQNVVSKFSMLMGVS